MVSPLHFTSCLVYIRFLLPSFSLTSHHITNTMPITENNIDALYNFSCVTTNLSTRIPSPKEAPIIDNVIEVTINDIPIFLISLRSPDLLLLQSSSPILLISVPWNRRK